MLQHLANMLQAMVVFMLDKCSNNNPWLCLYWIDPALMWSSSSSNMLWLNPKNLWWICAQQGDSGRMSTRISVVESTQNEFKQQ